MSPFMSSLPCILLMSSDPHFLSVIMRAVLNLPALHMPLQAAACSANLNGCLRLQIQTAAGGLWGCRLRLLALLHAHHGGCSGSC